MGLFGGKDDTKSKIEELKAKMQGGMPPPPGMQPPQQPWQQPAPGMQPPPQQFPPQQAPPPQAPPQQDAGWQPPRAPAPAQRREVSVMNEIETGIVLDLGDGMSLNLPIKGRMHLDEFLRIADRVRELKKIDHSGGGHTHHY